MKGFKWREVNFCFVANHTDNKKDMLTFSTWRFGCIISNEQFTFKQIKAVTRELE